MADNVTADPGSGGATLAADDVGGVYYPRSKLTLGADGVSDGDVSSTNPMPVTDAGVGGTADAAATAGSTGSLSAKLRLVTSQLNTLAGYLDGVETLLGTLALESGGNLAAAAASLSVMDDWDETDRAKVNIIAGQVGAQGASGVVTALTLRTVLATDVALPAGTNAIGKLAANSGVDIGDVDVTSVSGNVTVVNGGTFAVQATLAAGATAIAKAEDVASANADVGVPAMMIQKASPADTAGTDGDYVMLQGSAGRLWVDPSGVTLTVASHAVTNAGTFAVQATLAAGAAAIAKAEDVASADADVGVPAMMVRKAAPANTSGTDGDYEMLQGSAGRLWVDPSGVTLTVASHAVTNAGTFAVQESSTHIQADDAAFTPATSKVCMVGFEADESSTDSVDEGDGGAARMTLDRKIIVNPQPHTAGGLSTFMASGSDGSSILVATAQAGKASAGQLYGYYLYNPEAAVTFVHFYDTASGSVTVGTTNPLFTVAIPAGSAANLALTHGITFATAITMAATTTAGGNTAPATGVSAVIWYK